MGTWNKSCEFSTRLWQTEYKHPSNFPCTRHKEVSFPIRPELNCVRTILYIFVQKKWHNVVCKNVWILRTFPKSMLWQSRWFLKHLKMGRRVRDVTFKGWKVSKLLVAPNIPSLFLHQQIRSNVQIGRAFIFEALPWITPWKHKINFHSLSLLFVMEMSAHCGGDHSTFKRRWADLNGCNWCQPWTALVVLVNLF